MLDSTVNEKPAALVITVKELEEADLLVFFLDERGTLRRGIAKNAKKSMRRFLSCFEPFNLINLSYLSTPSRLLLKEAQLQMSFPTLRKDPMIMGMGNLMAEVLVAFVPENDPHGESFVLTVEALRRLNEKRGSPLLIVSIWMLRLMLIVGYSPNFDKCSICRVDLEKKRRWVWQLEPPRCVCADHYLTGSLKWEWDLETLMFLRSIRTLSLDKIWRLRFSSGKHVGLFRNICYWCESILQRELKSYRWLERVVRI